VFDELLTVLTGAELRVLLYICRRTFGFKKDSDNISLNQLLHGLVKKDGNRLDAGTGLSKPTLLKALRDLQDKGIIESTRQTSDKHGDEATNYRLRFSDGVTRPAAQQRQHQAGGRSKNFTTGGKETLPRGRSKNFTTPVVKKVNPQETVVQETDDRAREEINNNSGGTSTTSDVVVVLSAAKIATETTIQPNTAIAPDGVVSAARTTNPSQVLSSSASTGASTYATAALIDPTPLDPPASVGTNSQSNAAAALLAIGMADTVTKRLISRYSAERITEKIEFLAYLQEQAPERVKNPRGWLRRAIEENYGPPDGFLTEAERAQIAAEAERQAQAAASYAQRAQARQVEQEAHAAAWRQQLHAQYGATAEDLAFWVKAQEEIKFASTSHPDLKTLLAGAEILKCNGATVQIGIPQEAAFRQLGHPGTQKVIQRALTHAAGQAVEPEFVLVVKPREAE
jgi:hypothetical protein